MRRRILWGLVLVLATLGLSVSTAGSSTRPDTASKRSAIVSGCNWLNVYHVCLDANMGNKDPKHHLEWVEGVTVEPYGTAKPLETWGDGFYYKTDKTAQNVYYTVEKWVHNNTNVCGAATYNGHRVIACIHISV